MGLQRERVPAGAAVILGVLLALPTVVSPTWRLTTLDSQSGVVLFDQQDWSWGRTRLLGAGGAVTQDVWNPLGLAVLVVLLALAAVGAAAWLVSSAPWVRVAAPLATAALLGQLLAFAAARLGRPVRDDVHGLAASGASTSVGMLETGAVVVLLVAVALLALSSAGGRMPSAWVARARALGGPVDDDGARPSGARAGGRPVRVVSRPAGEHLAGPPVGLRDSGSDSGTGTGSDSGSDGDRRRSRP
ncbi:hypothetical protein GCM10009868_36410 [Terrabacter aerolatus]|uniref:Uncharacterized protein n=1 Tax=Terrabacter aerolatus TaxID=422442 RepID=A0A512CVZ1_9MICO|nr:hypothetical protein [Terrabacter aerolatus]GEO28376.1 hypothetical protein TAE01_01860 [Terrabacter aerolatus]